MAQVLPFGGLLPPPELAAAVSAVPYDVVSRAEAAALAADNPLSFLRVSRSEIELDEGLDPHSPEVYERAAQNFCRLREAARLRTDPGRHLYVYELTMGEQVQAGVVGAMAVADYESGVIRKHEKTRPDKEDDRTRHVLALRAHTGPVFLACRDSAAVAELVADVMTDAPLFDFTAADMVRHRLWRVGVAASQALSLAFAGLPRLYIADGHHRAASAARAAAHCRERNPGHRGDEPYNFFLGVVFPAAQLWVLPYNRAVRDLHGLGCTEFRKHLATHFEVTKTTLAAPERPGELGMCLADGWWRLRLRSDHARCAAADIIGRLDVSILQDLVLAPLLGIADPRTDQRIDFVGGIRGTAELARMVVDGSHAVAFAMYPTSIEELFAVADAAGIMPPKSTWFEPKLRDGLVCHEF